MAKRFGDVALALSVGGVVVVGFLLFIALGGLQLFMGAAESDAEAVSVGAPQTTTQ